MIFSSPSYNGLESIFLGLINDKASLTGLSLSNSMQNNLFASPSFTTGLMIDLAAVNINRGRDHGFPSYTQYRQYCGYPSVSTFEALNDTVPSVNIAKLKSVYSNVNDIDLYVGGLAETGVVINGSIDDSYRPRAAVVGAVFSCLLSKQFISLKQGDRFFYENSPSTASGTNSTAFSLSTLIIFKINKILNNS